MPSPTPDRARADVRDVGVFVAVLAIAATLALSITALVYAAGGDRGDGGTSAGAPTEAHVALSELAIDPTGITVAEGGTLLVENEGAVPHNLTVEDAGLTTGDIPAGGSASLDVSSLAPGTYTAICTIAGHEEGGMVAELTVVASDGAAPAAATDPAASEGAHAGHTDWAAMDAVMEETIERFPAATEGRGNQVLEPEVLPDGTKHFELTAAITPWEVAPGKVVQAWTYNGMVPGPQIFLEVGDTVEVELRNELPLGTDLHLHGIDIPNDMDGVAPLTQDLVAPGETFTYRFRTDEVAVAMYHAHHHAQMTVPNGLLGMIYVGDLPLPRGRSVGGQDVPADVRVSQEIPIVLNDAGEIGYSLNGKSFPATAPIVGRTGDWILVHYANEGTQIHPMHLHQMDQIVVAKDGYPLDEPYAADTLNVAPGERYSVLIQLETPGTWVWHCHILPHVEGEQGMFGMVTALVVEDAEATP